MNYHDILGIRPNAGSEEIELAYKGRRSQYHPDRYVNADAETQAWATAKMQELNEAYANLTDASARTTHNRRAGPAAQATNDETPRGGPPPLPPQATQRPATPSTDGLAEYLFRKVDGGLAWSKVFVAPRIPLKKISGALSTYASGVAPSEILVLLDNTVFGSAKDGVIITSREIRIRENALAPTTTLKLEKIGKLQWERQRLYADGREVAHLQIPEEGPTAFVIEQVNDFLASRRHDSETRADVPPPSGGRMTSSDALSRIHAQALAGLRHELEGDDRIGLVDLIDRQVRYMFRLPPLLDVTLKAPGRVGANATPANTVEVISTMFAIVHCYVLSKQTKASRASFGSDYSSLFGFCFLYQDKFRESFRDVLGRKPELDEESLMAVTGMFMGSDEVADMGLKTPGEQDVLSMLETSGINEVTGREVIAEFERQTNIWLGRAVVQAFSSR